MVQVLNSKPFMTFFYGWYKLASDDEVEILLRQKIIAQSIGTRIPTGDFNSEHTLTGSQLNAIIMAFLNNVLIHPAGYTAKRILELFLFQKQYYVALLTNNANPAIKTENERQ